MCQSLRRGREKKAFALIQMLWKKIFDLPVIPMKARKGIGINELKEAVYISDKKMKFTVAL